MKRSSVVRVRVGGGHIYLFYSRRMAPYIFTRSQDEAEQGDQVHQRVLGVLGKIFARAYFFFLFFLRWSPYLSVCRTI